VIIDSSTALLPSSTTPSTGTLTGTDPQALAGDDFFERDLDLRAIVANQAGALWGEIE
jgi:hypothetical protein